MARKAKVRPEKKRSLTDLLLKISIFAVTVYLVISLVAGQIDIISKRQELSLLDNKIAHQQSSNTELERVLASGDSNEYMERVAREKLGYVDPDAKVYMDISGK